MLWECYGATETGINTVRRPEDQRRKPGSCGVVVPTAEVLAASGQPAPDWFPLLGGHEGAGVVAEVGPGVTAVQPGDHVALSFIPACGSCRFCGNG